MPLLECLFVCGFLFELLFCYCIMCSVARLRLNCWQLLALVELMDCNGIKKCPKINEMCRINVCCAEFSFENEFSIAFVHGQMTTVTLHFQILSTFSLFDMCKIRSYYLAIYLFLFGERLTWNQEKLELKQVSDYSMRKKLKNVFQSRERMGWVSNHYSIAYNYWKKSN